MNLDELRSVQSKERQTDSLQHLRDSFYADVSAYISDLEDERDSVAEAAEDPYGDLVERMQANKRHVLDVLDTDAERNDVTTDEAAAVTAPDEHEPSVLGDESEPSVADADPGTEPATRQQADAAPDDGTGGDSRPSEHGDASADGARYDDQPREEKAYDEQGEAIAGSGMDARTTVRITGDVDEFYGVDQREYDLDPETVVALPEENAEPLLQSGDAERID